MGECMITLQQIIDEAKCFSKRPMYRDSTFTDAIYNTYLKGYERTSYDGVLPHISVADAGIYQSTHDNNGKVYRLAYYKFEPFALLALYGTRLNCVSYHIINDNLFDLVVDTIRVNSILIDPDECAVDSNDSIFDDLYSADGVGMVFVDNTPIS